jgi:hypothetical protein
VADRVANIFILAEDQEQQILARRYIQRASPQIARRIRPIDLPGSKQCGSQYVREQFPIQVKECRSRNGRKASCMLVVLTDADDLTTARREKELHEALADDGQSPVKQEEMIIIFIPKWQVETWIKCLLGEATSEADKKTDQPPVTATQIADAARTLHEWARPHAHIGATCVPSLKKALPRWRRLG